MKWPDVARRALLRGGALAGGGVLVGGGARAFSGPPVVSGPPVLSGEAITLRIGRGAVAMGGRMARAVAINGSVPGPVLRLRQGQMLRLTVVNELAEETSLHWHGLELPFQMDGVPGVSFPGIAPGASFTYAFPITQSGTYWYHSHSGLQEMMGCYGALVIDPAEPEPEPVLREHVLLFSDHSFVDPARILARLKADPGYYNHQPQTLADLLAGGKQAQPLGQRLAWARMRMDPTDIADVTGSVLHYLVNGHDAADNWTGLFTPGEAVRLRCINAAAMTFFNLRIPDLPLEVVAADGQAVQPVVVDEFQFGSGETYDVIVRPGPRAYTIAAETMDRSGMACATLAPAAGMKAAVPPLRPRPLLTMKDMGMAMSGGAMGPMKMRDGANAPQVALGPGVEMISPMPQDRSGDPGIGLDQAGHRVLTYRDLLAAAPNPDPRAPEREIEVHLTGAMNRYMWSIDGRRMQEAHEPIPMRKGERLRMTLVNDTMMAHPIHLHGHPFELVTGHGTHAP
ncbi:MAG TPA: copper resistance system multicopper oxidase, partial [Novosphingobium sp.]|nr:copper resistance system multicopper oxidase [Novosphingobium sp.]